MEKKKTKEEISTMVRWLVSGEPAHMLPGFGELPAKKQAEIFDTANKVQKNLMYQR